MTNNKNPLIEKALSTLKKEKMNSRNINSGNLIEKEGDDRFSEHYKIACELSTSTLVPEAYKGKAADMLLFSELSTYMKIPLYLILQNIDVINGKAGWKSAFAIGLINASGRFSSRLRYEYKGQEDTDERSCRAYAYELDNSKCYGPWVSIKMAKSEGWLDKPGSLWKSIPELMLAYRAAAFFSRLHCPDLLHGLLLSEELVDISPISMDSVRIEEAISSNTHDAALIEESIKRHSEEENSNLNSKENHKPIKSKLSILQEKMEEAGYLLTEPKDNTNNDGMVSWWIKAEDTGIMDTDIKTLERYGFKSFRGSTKEFVLNITSLYEEQANV